MSHIKSYTVVRGDNLTKIAKANNTTVNALLGANTNIKDPNLILVGQEIKIPEAETVDLSNSTQIEEVVPEVESKGPSLRDMSIEHQRQVHQVNDSKIEDKVETIEPIGGTRDEGIAKQQAAIDEAAQIQDKIEEEKVEEIVRDESYNAQQNAMDEATQLQEQQEIEKIKEEVSEAAQQSASTVDTTNPVALMSKLVAAFTSLKGVNYAGGNGRVGRCGKNTKKVLEGLNLIIPDGVKSHGGGYARKLDSAEGAAGLIDGYETIGKDIAKIYGNDNASKAFEELLNGGNFEAIVISFIKLM